MICQQQVRVVMGARALMIEVNYWTKIWIDDGINQRLLDAAALLAAGAAVGGRSCPSW